MEAESNQNADELIMGLVDMGFELEDAQAALENGKATAQEAVEWILAGKPITPKPLPTLKLAPVAATIPPVPEAPVDQASSNPEPMDTSGGLTSRLHMSEEQYQAKANFERKQMEEARKKALAEKKEKQKAHAEALRRIQDDREKQKVRNVVQVPAREDNATSSETFSTTTRQTNNDTSLLQIRQIDGKMLKHSFPCETLLEEVKQFVKEQSGHSFDIILIQPFPRIEYTDVELQQTLKSLGLVPNGSLVVKKCESSSVDPVIPQAPPLIQPPVAPEIMDESVQAEPEVSDDENVNDGDEDYDMLPQAPGIQGLPPLGGIHGMGRGRGGGYPPQMPFPPGFNMGRGAGPFNPFQGHHQAQNQHNWGGLGQRLAGDMLENVELPHQKQDPKQLAAEAARKRFDIGGAVPVPGPSADVAPVKLAVIPTLLDLSLSNVSSRICCTRNPIVGLHGIPADLGAKILDYLIKEKLLNPKTLAPLRSCRLRRMVLDCYPYCTNELLHSLRHHSYLKHISLCSCPLITDKGLEHLSGLKYLRHLSLSGCRQMNNLCVPVLISLSNLETLLLEDTSITDSGIIEYSTAAPPNLQYLSLSRTDITHAVLPSLKSIPLLRRLNLEQTKVGGLLGVQNLTALVDLNVASTQIYTDSVLCLKDHPSLRALNISSTPNVVGDMALQFLSGLKLRSLELPGRSSTTDAGIQHIAGMPLEVLDLTNYTNVTDASMEVIANIKTIRVLRLSNTKVGDAGMVFLAGLYNLEELFVDKTVVTNVGASVVSNFQRLRELSLANTGITNGLLREGSLNRCLELTKLNLSKTRTSEKGLVHLRLTNLALLNIDDTYAHPDKIAFLERNCPHLSRVIYNTLRPVNEEEEQDLGLLD